MSVTGLSGDHRLAVTRGMRRGRGEGRGKGQGGDGGGLRRRRFPSKAVNEVDAERPLDGRRRSACALNPPFLLENKKGKDTHARLVDALALNPSGSSLLTSSPPVAAFRVATFCVTFRPTVSHGRYNSKAALGNDKPLKGWLSMSRPGAIPFSSCHRRQWY